MSKVLLGTVAIEPNRWALIDGSGAPTVAVSAVLDEVAAAGFDGVELWERHLVGVGEQEAESIIRHQLPVAVLSSYVSFDDADSATRDAIADWAHRTGASGVKYNVGNSPELFDAYVERLTVWLERLPSDTAALCECHFGISIAEDPKVAAKLFDAVGPADRVQAIVHTHDDDDLIRAKFDSFGDRISHIHVNFLDFANGTTSASLADNRDLFESKARLLKSLGFAGSWTIEFVHGVMTDYDTPEYLLASAIDDLRVMREVVA